MFRALLRFNDIISKKDLNNFIDKVLSKTYRVKGLVQLGNKRAAHVDCVGSYRKIKILEEQYRVFEESQLIFIGDKKRLKKIIKELWADNFAIDSSID